MPSHNYLDNRIKNDGIVKQFNDAGHELTAFELALQKAYDRDKK